MNPTVEAIGWTLIHFCWQAAAIAAFYRCLSLLAARGSSNTRYLLALGTLLLMAATAVGTFAFEMHSKASLPEAPGTRTSVMPDSFSQLITARSEPAMPGSAWQPASPDLTRSRLLMSVRQLPVLGLIDGLWLLGVLVLSLRSLGGWCLIQRLHATLTLEAPDRVQASFRAIGSALKIHRPVLLRVSGAVTGPVTVGALRALVLLPVSALASLSPDELEAVLAHELAHVRRADFFWNLVQTLVETLFFFHPAVWWISGRIRRERELCCDDLALSVCPRPLAYANALFELEQQRSRIGQLSMALSGHQPARTLGMRIARILGEPVASTGAREPFSLAAAASVLVLLLLPVPQLMASLKPASNPDQEQAALSIAAAPVAAQVAPVAAQVAPVAAQVAAESVVPSAPAPARVAVSVARPKPKPDQEAQAREDEAPEQNAGKEGEKGDYIDRMKAEGYDLELDKYIAMKVEGVTPEYARAMSQLGFGKLNADQLIACKVQGVTPEYIAKIKSSGFKVETVQDAISYRIFAVTPEFIAGMKDAGFDGLTAQQLLALRVEGVTPEYARRIKEQFPGASSDELAKTRIFNINAAFISSAQRHGFKDLTIEKLVKLRISGVLDEDVSR
jgi:beta-lactamase regulating signal transducer with metallopeptidase domain